MKIVLRTTSLQLFTLVAAMIALQMTPLRADDVFDGRKSLAYDLQEKVGEPRVIERTPIFDNAPFLKLKAGDKLVRAKGWSKGGKGDKPQFNEFESYFLLTGGKYYRLDWGGVQRNKKPVLTSTYQSLLFDWDVSLDNAKLLVKIDKYQFGESLLFKDFANLKNALRKDFPETLRDVGQLKISAPRLQGKGTMRRAIFQGLSFSRYSNTISKYQFEIGNGIHIHYFKKLIVGPRHVNPEEFEECIEYKADDNMDEPMPPNMGIPNNPDAETAAKLRAEFERMEKFQAIVNNFLAQPPLAEG